MVPSRYPDLAQALIQNQKRDGICSAYKLKGTSNFELQKSFVTSLINSPYLFYLDPLPSKDLHILVSIKIQGGIPGSYLGIDLSFLFLYF